MHFYKDVCNQLSLMDGTRKSSIFNGKKNYTKKKNVKLNQTFQKKEYTNKWHFEQQEQKKLDQINIKVYVITTTTSN